MEQSPHLSLSYVMPAQAQKHVTVNESFRRLDALTQMSVASRGEATEPALPAEGDAYILPADPSGDAWSGYSENDIAVYQDGAWARIAPGEGFRAWVSDDDEFVVFDGAAWSELSGGGSSETAVKFGINTIADTTNKLAVKSDAVLFNHDDVTPGSGDCQVKINKDAADDKSSLLFQTGASGRAELGLTGDDDFRIKVSPDNFSTVYEPVRISKDSGHIGVNGAPSATTVVTITGAAGTNPPDGDFHIQKEDGFAIISLTEYSSVAATNSPFSIQRRARGSLASPAAVASGDWLGGFSFRAYSGGAFLQRALVCALIDGAVSGTTAPTALVFQTGSTSLAERMRIASDGGVVVGGPTGGSKGAGAVNAQAVYDDNALLSCYVFDQALDGAISFEKWDGKVPGRIVPERRTIGEDGEETVIPGRTEPRMHEPMRKFAARIGTEYDPLTLDGYARHWREKRHLTAMPNEASFDPVTDKLAAGEWIQRLVETVEIQAVLLEALNQRLKAVEARERA